MPIFLPLSTNQNIIIIIINNNTHTHTQTQQPLPAVDIKGNFYDMVCKTASAKGQVFERSEGRTRESLERCLPVIEGLGRERQEVQELLATLGDTVSPCVKIKRTNKSRWGRGV